MRCVASSASYQPFKREDGEAVRMAGSLCRQMAPAGSEKGQAVLPLAILGHLDFLALVLQQSVEEKHTEKFHMLTDHSHAGDDELALRGKKRCYLCTRIIV